MLVRLRALYRAWRHRATVERDTHDELRFHVESRADDLVRRGLAPEQAARQARLEFGNPSGYRDQCRDARGLRLADDFAADVRFALRGFRRHKALSAIVVVTLTFGIGVSSGVFTLYSAITLRPMVDTDPETFLRVFATSAVDRSQLKPYSQLSVEEYVAFRDGLRSVRALSAQSRFSTPLGADDPGETSMNFATCNFFDVYGPKRPVLGRLLQASDCDAAAPVIVLSHTLWQTRFGGDTTIVGRTLLVRGRPLTVVGVAPPTASGMGIAYAWLPFTLRGELALGDDPRRLIDGHYAHERWLNVTGRLAPGATREQVAAELAVIAGRQDRLHGARVSATTVTDGAMVHDPLSRSMVLSIVTLVMGALTCLVLIACANVATLLLSRADARQQEVALRLSLGAGRGRLLRMLLTETLTLAACAGAGSVYVAYRLPGVLAAWLIGTAPELQFTPDWRVFLYLAAAVGFAGVAAGLAPSIESMRVDVLEALKGRRSTLGSAASGARVRAGLVTVQIALSFVLLLGAALFVITHYYTVTRQVGLETAHVFMPRVIYRAPQGALSTSPSPAAITEALQQVPGVQAVVFAAAAPVVGPPTMEVALPGSIARPVRANEVSPGYFGALDIPIVRGRALDANDRPCGRGRCHVVVSETLARQVLRADDPVGLTLQTKEGTTLEVVGVARDTSVQQFNVPDPPQLYLPWAIDGRSYQALVRFTGGVERTGPAVSAALRTAFPGAVLNVRTLQSIVESWVEEVGRMETLIAVLGVTAVALAALGVFGVVSFAVSRRRQELGIRLALGATRRDIYVAVVGGAVKPVVVGLIAGIGLALLTAVAFARLLHELRFAVSPRDPVTYAGITLLLLAIITLALWPPARRAAAINPLVALRCE